MKHFIYIAMTIAVPVTLVNRTKEKTIVIRYNGQNSGYFRDDSLNFVHYT